jgi:hypothetical protein
MTGVHGGAPVGRTCAHMHACGMACVCACGVNKHAYVCTYGVNRHAYVRACGLNSRALGARLMGAKFIFFGDFNVFYGQDG